jgi:hypothetical protein
VANKQDTARRFKIVVPLRFHHLMTAGPILVWKRKCVVPLDRQIIGSICLPVAIPVKFAGLKMNVGTQDIA